MYIVVGLGNPNQEHQRTRHNTGRMFTGFVAENLPADGSGIKILTPNTYMNDSGPAVTKVIAGKSAKNLIVVYDDLDIPLGEMKISYDRGSGGHRGLESVIKALKTREFIRIRIGISPTTPTGKLKKPKGEDAVMKFILGEFKPAEVVVLKKVFKKAKEALKVMVEDGLEMAMNHCN
ncbi:MAG: aminoacyl-tRNA hydrolase [bacterium]